MLFWIKTITKRYAMHARSQKIFSGGGGGGVQIPRRGLTENFNTAKINNLAIPEGGGGPDPLSPPLDPPMQCMYLVYNRDKG